MTGYIKSCTAVKADSFITVPAHTGYITLLLFAWRQDRRCTCDVTLMGVCAIIGEGLKFWGRALEVALLYNYGENPPFMGNAATLIVGGNISLTINIELGNTVTEFSAIVRYWGKGCT